MHFLETWAPVTQPLLSVCMTNPSGTTSLANQRTAQTRGSACLALGQAHWKRTSPMRALCAACGKARRRR
eukprot:4611696-Pyramimonas_sp.AAC.1